MDLVIDATGVVRCVYGETIDLHLLGSPQIERASHVEQIHLVERDDGEAIGAGAHVRDRYGKSSSWPVV